MLLTRGAAPQPGLRTATMAPDWRLQQIGACSWIFLCTRSSRRCFDHLSPMGNCLHGCLHWSLIKAISRRDGGNRCARYQSERLISLTGIKMCTSDASPGETRVEAGRSLGFNKAKQFSILLPFFIFYLLYIPFFSGVCLSLSLTLLPIVSPAALVVLLLIVEPSPVWLVGCYPAASDTSCLSLPIPWHCSSHAHADAAFSCGSQTRHRLGTLCSRLSRRYA